MQQNETNTVPPRDSFWVQYTLTAILDGDRQAVQASIAEVSGATLVRYFSESLQAASTADTEELRMLSGAFHAVAGDELQRRGLSTGTMLDGPGYDANGSPTDELAVTP